MTSIVSSFSFCALKAWNDSTAPSSAGIAWSACLMPSGETVAPKNDTLRSERP